MSKKVILQQHNAATAHPEAAALHSLAPCALHYLQAMEDPFSLNAEVCIPDLHAVPSKKVKVTTRGAFEAGTQGEAFVALIPQCKTSDAGVLLITNSLYAGTSTTPLPRSGTGLVSVNAAKLPYTTTDFDVNQTVRGRVVGVGLRVRYTGTELNRGGKLIALRHPDNADLIPFTPQFSSQAITQFETARTYPITRDWVTLNYRPTRPSEYNYASSACGDADEAVGAFRYSSVFCVTGAVPSAPFEFQVVQFIEYIPGEKGSIDNVTKVHSDIVGLSHIRNNLAETSSTRKPAQQLYNSLKRTGRDILKHSAPMVIEHVQKSAANKAIDWVKSQVSEIGKTTASNLISSMFKTMPMIEKSIAAGFPLAEMLPLMLM
jgi:hypothetical protein